MKKYGIGARLRYSFDNIMAKGTPAMIMLLAIASIMLLSFFSAVVYFLQIAPEEAEGNFIQIFWMSLMRTLDSGTMGGDTGYFGLVMLGVTLVGIFVISALIGIINNGLESRLESIRKGRSVVLEKDHTIILGWSEQIFTVIAELLAANESRGRSCIVVMGRKEKPEMEDEIRAQFPSTGRTRIVCRQGEPADLNDIDIANPDASRAIIILSPDDSDAPDAEVVKTLLAITNNPDRKKEKYNIVAQIRDPKNLDIARIVGKDEAEIVLIGDIISRIMAQTCRQTGLSIVYNELLDFDGDEIYMKLESGFIGKTYADTLFAYPNCTVIGLINDDGPAVLNPPMNTVLKAGDELIVIAADDSAVKIDPKFSPKIDEAYIATGTPEPAKPESTLILGWNWRTPIIIRELDSYVAPGSRVTVAADYPAGEEDIKECCSEKIRNQTITYINADTTSRAFLDSLGIENYDHVILLCYSDMLSAEEADSRTLITLLHLRDMAEKKRREHSIVSEMINIRNRDLAQVTKVNDFIVSDKIVSLLLTQIAENRRINSVFTDMFDPEGSEVYIKPATDYVKSGSRVTFATVIESAKRRNETAIGYKIAADSTNADKAYGVRVNPDKNETVMFTGVDKIIVLADN